MRRICKPNWKRSLSLDGDHGIALEPARSGPVVATSLRDVGGRLNSLGNDCPLVIALTPDGPQGRGYNSQSGYDARS